MVFTPLLTSTCVGTLEFRSVAEPIGRIQPAISREPRFYTKVFKECHMNDESGNSFEPSLVGCKCIGAYVRNKKNQNQICWIWQKN